MPSCPRVAFFSPIWARKGPLQLGWSDYWRLALPAIELHRNGWDVVLGRAVGPGDGGRLSIQDPDGNWWEDRDVLVFHRWMTDHAPELLRRAREAGQVVVNDVDDLLWDMPADHPGHGFFGYRGFNLDNWRATLRESSVVVASTPYLVEALGDLEDVPHARLVRNYVDADAWPERPPGQHVGWVGATAGRGEDLAVLREAVVPWLREKDLPLYHGGVIAGEPKMRDVLDYPNVVGRSFQPPQSYPRLWDPLRVALCPLGEHPFARAKSWVKPLEACARGIPFVASDHDEYHELGTGRIASSPQEWAWHLKALEDPATYASDCLVNRKCFEQLTIQGNWSEWADLLAETVSVPASVA